MGCDLLYAVWASVKWGFKLVHVWSSEALAFHCSAYSSKIPALVIIIFPMLMIWVSVSGVPWDFFHYEVLADGVEDIGYRVVMGLDMVDCLMAGFI